MRSFAKKKKKGHYVWERQLVTSSGDHECLYLFHDRHELSDYSYSLAACMPNKQRGWNYNLRLKVSLWSPASVMLAEIWSWPSCLKTACVSELLKLNMIFQFAIPDLQTDSNLQALFYSNDENFHKCTDFILVTTFSSRVDTHSNCTHISGIPVATVENVFP